MSVDPDDARIAAAFSRLADDAPLPESWPDLGDPVVRMDRQAAWAASPRRRVAIGAVLGAAACLVIVAAVFATQRTGPTDVTHAAAQPTTHQRATTGADEPAALGGHWAANGPRLSDEQLMWVIAEVTLANGTTMVVPRSGSSTDGKDMELDSSRRVVGVSVARTTRTEFGLAFTPSGVGILTNDQRAQILQYLDSLPPRDRSSVTGATPQGAGPEVTIAVVHTEPVAPSQPGSASECDVPDATDHPECGRRALNFVWIFPTRASKPTSRYVVAALPSVDVLAGLGPVGEWTPGSATSAPTSDVPSSPTSLSSIPGATAESTIPTVPSTSASPDTTEEPASTTSSSP